MLDRVWRGRSLPTFGTAVFAALLLTMTALSVLSTIVFRSLDGQRRQTADAAIREYAALGARLFGDRAFGVFEGSRLRILASVYGSRPGPGEPRPDFDRFVDVANREMDLIGFAVADPNRGFFAIDLATGAYRGAGGAQGDAIGRRIAEMIRQRPAPTERRLEPLVWLMADLPEPVSVGYTALRARSGQDLAYYGFTYTRRVGWKHVGDAVMRDLPLLPGSFIDPNFRYGLDRSRTDSLIAVRLFDATGEVLYESRKPFPGEIEGEFVFRTGPGGFRASATLHPALVEEIRANLNASYRAALQFC
jgi:hypothetical protein